jgi:triosephosphate isomerase
MLEERTPLVAANWKMQKTVGETEAFLAAFTGRMSQLGRVDLVVCPPYTSLAAATAIAAGSGIAICAQNVHEEESGAFTGEVSIPMLDDIGAAGAIVGHSERRQLFCETDEALARKVPALLEAGLLPILCCGETESERDAEETEAVLERQITADLAAVAGEDLSRVVIAYEPIWAIGTGRTATPDQAEEAIGFIRGLVSARDEAAGRAIRILYGGSVKPDNAVELFAREGIDGGLVGGASLDPDDFTAICAAAGR